MPGRAYHYYIAQMLTDIYPGAAQNLLIGIAELSRGLQPTLQYDEEFETSTLEEIPWDIRIKLRKLMGRTLG